MATKFSLRFVELLQEATRVAATKVDTHSEYTGRSSDVHAGALLGWSVKCRNLLAMSCGQQSEHYQQFLQTEKITGFSGNWSTFQLLKAILEAAQDDYEGGHLHTVRSLVQAEIFLDELEQSRALLAAGYRAPAAVVAGVVLETKLRELCATRALGIGKLDKMNADLAKAQVYNLAVQKRITAIADIRNNAAHGHPELFKTEDVADMIAYIERFLADYP